MRRLAAEAAITDTRRHEQARPEYVFGRIARRHAIRRPRRTVRQDAARRAAGVGGSRAKRSGRRGSWRAAVAGHRHERPCPWGPARRAHLHRY